MGSTPVITRKSNLVTNHQPTGFTAKPRRTAIGCSGGVGLRHPDDCYSNRGNATRPVAPLRTGYGSGRSAPPCSLRRIVTELCLAGHVDREKCADIFPLESSIQGKGHA
ncbi:hypothetical protein GOODEAATRI_029305, partial [Goodea atripinnis]